MKDNWSVDEVYTAADGTVYGTTYNTEYGKVYIPTGADANTPMCGNFMGDVNLSATARDYAASAGCKSILFFGDKNNTKGLVENMANFSSSSGLGNTNQVSFMGGSGGGGATLLAGSYAIDKGMTVTSCTSLANWKDHSEVTNISTEVLQGYMNKLIENDVPYIVGYYDSGSLAGAEYLPSMYASMGGKALGFELKYNHNNQVFGPYSAGFIDILNGESFDNMAKLIDPKGDNSNRYIIFNEDGTVSYNISEEKFLELFNSVLTATARQYISNLSDFTGSSTDGLPTSDGKVVCNDEQIREALNKIRNSMSKSNFVSNEFTASLNGSTTDIPSKEASEIKKITDALTSIYQKIAHDTEEIAFMTWMYNVEDTAFEKYANEINDALKAAQEAARNSSGSSGYSTGGGYIGGIGGGYAGGYGGGYGGGGTTTAPSTDDEDNNKDDENKGDENKDNENKDNENNEDLNDLETTEFDDYWPDYDTLVSDEDKLVYNCDDEFKLIVHTDGDEVTGLEHMFKFASEDEALGGLEKIKQDYKDVDNVDKIILNDNLIKVLFNKLAFKDLTREDAKTMYEHLGEITSVENKQE